MSRRDVRATRFARRATLATAAAVALVAGCTVTRREEEPRGTQEAESVKEQREEPRKEIITPEGVTRLPVFSPAVRSGDFIFLSGAIGTRPGEMHVVEGGVKAETRQTFENIKTVLAAAGATLDDVVKCTVFLADIADYAAMNEAYLEFFPENPPARSAMAGSGLALGAKVEIECIAAAPEED